MFWTIWSCCVRESLLHFVDCQTAIDSNYLTFLQYKRKHPNKVAENACLWHVRYSFIPIPEAFDKGFTAFKMKRTYLYTYRYIKFFQSVSN